MNKITRATIPVLWILLFVFPLQYARADGQHKDSDQNNPSTEGNYGLTDNSQVNPSTDGGTNGHGDSTEDNPSFETAVTTTSSYNDTKVSFRIYDINGKEREVLHHGINIVKMSDGNTRKVVVR